MWHKFDFIRFLGLTRFVLLFVLTSCAFFKQQIGGKSHQFNVRPTKIIWIQIPGLSSSHFALTKVGQTIFEKKIALESATCLGKTWDYNLFELTPDEFSTIDMQLMGSRNDKRQCSEKEYIWKEMERFGFTSGVYLRNQFEPFKDRSFLGCLEDEENRVVVWKSEPGSKNKGELFHYLEKQKPYYLNYTYQDKGCREDRCNSDFSKVVISLYEEFFKKREFFFFNIQDHSYLKLLEDKNLVGMQNFLEEIDSTIKYFKNIKDENLLILFSMVDPVELKIPEKMNDWKKINKKLKISRKSIQSEVLAFGASAENYCGIYHGGELKGRTMQGVRGK